MHIIWTAFQCNHSERSLHLLGNIIASETAGTKFKRDSSPLNKCLNLYKVRLPSAAGMVFRVTHIISRYSMLSAKITSP